MAFGAGEASDVTHGVDAVGYFGRVGVQRSQKQFVQMEKQQKMMIKCRFTTRR